MEEVSPGRWTLSFSGHLLEISVFPADKDPGEGPRGLDFHIPTGLLEEQTRTMVEYLLDLASEWKMTAFDPQLGRTVRSSDSEIIVSGWNMQNDYILTTVGSDGSTAGGGAYYPSYDEGISPSTKFWLWVGGLVLFLLLFIRFCV